MYELIKHIDEMITSTLDKCYIDHKSTFDALGLSEAHAKLFILYTIHKLMQHSN